MSELSRYPECRHILPSGRKCHSPALREKTLCYYHSRSRTLVDANRSRKHSIALPPLEDHAAIQMSLDEILAALGAHKISRREASTYLFALQIAMKNLARMDGLPAPAPVELCRDERGDIIAAPEPPIPTAAEPAPSDSIPVAAAPSPTAHRTPKSPQIQTPNKLLPIFFSTIATPWPPTNTTPNRRNRSLKKSCTASAGKSNSPSAIHLNREPFTLQCPKTPQTRNPPWLLHI
jgi:hypothetical protein